MSTLVSPLPRKESEATQKIDRKDSLNLLEDPNSDPNMVAETLRKEPRIVQHSQHSPRDAMLIQTQEASEKRNTKNSLVSKKLRQNNADANSSFHVNESVNTVTAINAY